MTRFGVLGWFGISAHLDLGNELAAAGMPDSASRGSDRHVRAIAFDHGNLDPALLEGVEDVADPRLMGVDAGATNVHIGVLPARCNAPSLVRCIAPVKRVGTPVPFIGLERPAATDGRAAERGIDRGHPVANGARQPDTMRPQPSARSRVVDVTRLTTQISGILGGRSGRATLERAGRTHGWWGGLFGMEPRLASPR